MSQPLKFRVLIPPLCAGIALLVGTGAASAQATAMQSAAKVSSADKAFVDKAASGGMAEIEMSKLAQQKASNDQVKQFGTHMVDDHTHAADELKQVATSKGLTLPSDIDHEAVLRKPFAKKSCDLGFVFNDQYPHTFHG